VEATGASKPTVEASGPAHDGQRALIVAAAAVRGSQALAQIRRHAADERTRLLVVAPALTDSPIEHAMGSVDDAIAAAQQRLETSIAALREHGYDVRGHVGDSDPLLAIEDGLREFGADSIVLVTAAGDDAHWLEGDLFERAKRRFEPPIVHVEIDRRGAGGDVAAVQTDGADAESPPDSEYEGYSKNLPRFSARDLLGIVVAVIGTMAAILIAVGCGDETLQRTTAEAGEGSSGSCVAAQVVAGLTALINVAHVVGLVLFESIGYRGGWARFFATLSLVGTPLAVLATVLLAH
jgi:hypothetical protein